MNMHYLEFGEVRDSIKLRETVYDSTSKNQEFIVQKIDATSPNELILDTF